VTKILSRAAATQLQIMGKQAQIVHCTTCCAAWLSLEKYFTLCHFLWTALRFHELSA